MTALAEVATRCVQNGGRDAQLNTLSTAAEVVVTFFGSNVESIVNVPTSARFSLFPFVACAPHP